MGRLRELIRQNLVLARKQSRYKQSDVAEALNLTTKAVSDWECGRSSPSFDHLDELAKFYGLKEEAGWFCTIRPAGELAAVQAQQDEDPELSAEETEQIMRFLSLPKIQKLVNGNYSVGAKRLTKCEAVEAFSADNIDVLIGKAASQISELRTGTEG